MDLIYTDENRADMGVLKEYDFDLAFGAEENDFELSLPIEKHCCGKNCFLYIEGTEYGGIIDAVEVDTAKSEVRYSGRTWHGIIEKKIILPLSEGDASTETVTVKETDAEGNSYLDKYLIVSGEANAVLGWLIERLGLSGLIAGSEEDSGIEINEYQFHRYIDGYSGILKMLADAGAKMKIKYSSGAAVLSAVPVGNYSTSEELDSDKVDFKLEKTYNRVNHLICLGSGQLDERLIVHLYADAEGNISQTQSVFGIEELQAVYDYSDAETVEMLIEGGMEELKNAWEEDAIEISFNDDSNAFDIGDIIKAVEHTTGLVATETVAKKIVKIKSGTTTISYKVGEK